MAPNQILSQRLHKPLQLLQSWSPFGDITTYLVDQKWSFLVISIYLYDCELWTLTACRVREKNASLWDKMLQGLLNISSNDHITNAEVCRKIQAAIGEYDELLALVKKRKLRWFGHVSRSSGLTKTILQGTVKRQTEKVGRQYQSVDRNGLCQLN